MRMPTTARCLLGSAAPSNMSFAAQLDWKLPPGGLMALWVGLAVACALTAMNDPDMCVSQSGLSRDERLQARCPNRGVLEAGTRASLPSCGHNLLTSWRAYTT